MINSLTKITQGNGITDTTQTRVYEKLRFDRVRQAQLSGEDLRNRWHNALKNLTDGEEFDPDDIKIKVNHSCGPSAMICEPADTDQEPLALPLRCRS